MEIDILLLSFALLIFSYYFLLGVIYLYAKTTNILYTKKVKISTLGIGYILTSVSSLYLLGHMMYFISDYKTLNYIIWLISALYIMFTLTKSIPYKLYIITHKGLFSLNPQINFKQKIFKGWRSLHIRQIESQHNFFIVQVIDEDFGDLKIPMAYDEYYKIISNLKN